MESQGRRDCNVVEVILLHLELELLHLSCFYSTVILKKLLKDI